MQIERVRVVLDDGTDTPRAPVVVEPPVSALDVLRKKIKAGLPWGLTNNLCKRVAWAAARQSVPRLVVIGHSDRRFVQAVLYERVYNLLKGADVGGVARASLVLGVEGVKIDFVPGPQEYARWERSLPPVAQAWVFVDHYALSKYAWPASLVDAHNDTEIITQGILDE